MRLIFRVALTGFLAAAWPRPPALGGAEPGRAPGEAPPLLGEAFNRLMDNQGRWAYTETHFVSGLPGRSGEPTVLRVNPSRPYAEQYAPLLVDGRAPTKSDLESFRGIGERVAKRRKRDRDESGAHRGDELKMRLNFQVFTPDLARSSVVAEDADSVTYEVPLREEGGGPDAGRFQVTARVSKARREFEHASIRQRAPMRIALVATVADAAFDFDFTPVDPGYPAVIARATQRATVGFLFMRRALSFEMRRSDFARVTPYDERFGVKFGPIRTIEF